MQCRSLDAHEIQYNIIFCTKYSFDAEYFALSDFKGKRRFFLRSFKFYFTLLELKRQLSHQCKLKTVLCIRRKEFKTTTNRKTRPTKKQMQSANVAHQYLVTP